MTEVAETKVISVQLPMKVVKQVETLAKAGERSVSAEVRLALKAWLLSDDESKGEAA